MSKQKRRILVTSGLPYANGAIHLGHPRSARLDKHVGDLGLIFVDPAHLQPDAVGSLTILFFVILAKKVLHSFSSKTQFNPQFRVEMDSILGESGDCQSLD